MNSFPFWYRGLAIKRPIKMSDESPSSNTDSPVQSSWWVTSIQPPVLPCPPPLPPVHFAPDEYTQFTYHPPPAPPHPEIFAFPHPLYTQRLASKPFNPITVFLLMWTLIYNRVTTVHNSFIYYCLYDCDKDSE